MKISRQGVVSVLFVTGFLGLSTLVAGTDSPSTSKPPENSSSNWIPIGKRLRASSSTFVSIVASRHALSPSMAVGLDRSYLTWAELDEKGVAQVHVKYWNQEAWTLLGGMLNLDSTRQAYDPAIALIESTPYVAWIELDKKAVPQLHLKYWTPSGWVLQGTSLNADLKRAAANPSLTTDSGKLYISWSEADEKRVYQIHAKVLSNGEWMKLGGSLNENPSKDGMEPSMVMVGTTPYVAWSEKSANGIFQIYVKHWTGEAWTRGGADLNLNVSSHAISPSIASNGEAPSVAWVEFNEKGISQIHVKHLKDDNWISTGGSLNLDPDHHALNPSMAFKGDTLYVAWTESDSNGIPQLHIKRWSGSDWVLEEKSLNLDASKPALTPSLAVLGERPYVAWKESDSIGLYSIIVKAKK
jgi:hypothetical protein